MAMNKFMHPRNPYKKVPDFLQLTLEYPDLRKFVKPDLSGKIKINFKCDGAVRELTKCLLHKDFGLTIELPPNRLVPTLPLRMNYLLWIEDLLNQPGKQFHGVDIGTGASCIYPLLASKHFNWKMTGTEIDEESISYANKNIISNNLKDFITLKSVNSEIMLSGALEEDFTYDFCMCNPPFYSDESEISGKARTDRRAPPRNFRSGQNFELVAPGGETAFISRIIDDSVKLGCKVKVYTVMIGHKSNLNKVKELVKKVNPFKVRTTEFCQGRTTRWGLAWTFSKESHLISTAMQPRKEQSKPPFRWVYPHKCYLNKLKDQVISILNNLNINVSIIENEEENCGLCLKAYKNTWTHSRRKRREEKRKLVDEQAISPCDSVVTNNDSAESNNPLSPSSPIDSLGYNSFNDAEEDETSVEVNNTNNKLEPIPGSSHLENECNLMCKSETFENSSEIDVSNIHKFSLTPDNFDKSRSSDKFKLTTDYKSQVLDESSKITRNPENNLKRKQESSLNSAHKKKFKPSLRPLLEAVLVLSEYDDDIIFSLSFVDGTGGRESANQVLQFLKNKLS